MKTLKVTIIGLAIILFVVLVIQNLEVLSQATAFKANLIFDTFEGPGVPLYLLIAVAFILGFGLALAVGLIKRHQMRKEIKALNLAQGSIRQELDSLRNLPITGGQSLAISKREGASETQQNSNGGI
jgi:uncharacterized integral membrane protein